MENNYCLYWLHYPDFKYPELEGYIGITRDLNRRISEHTNYTKYAHIKNRIAAGATFKILHEGLTKREAEVLEEQYRPTENVGWNIAKGGNIPPSRRGKVSDGILLTGDNRTEKQKISSKNHRGRMNGKPAPNRKAATMFGQNFVSIKQACQTLELAKSQYYKYIEYTANGLTFDTPEDLKKYILTEKNKKISETRISRNFHYNQYTNK